MNHHSQAAGLTLCLACLLTASTAGAQSPSPAASNPAPSGPRTAPQPSYGPPPETHEPEIELSEPDPEPGMRTHDGFYLRLGLGGGYLNATGEATYVGNTYDATIRGGTFAGEFLIGTTVASGLVIGGGSMGAAAYEPQVTLGNDRVKSENTVNLGLIGVFADWYLNPREGLHLQAMIGYSTLTAQGSTGPSSLYAGNANASGSGTGLNADSELTQGIGLGLGFGHEWWIGEQWSLGVLGRLTVSRLWRDGHLWSESFTVSSPGVLCTLTYH